VRPSPDAPFVASLDPPESQKGQKIALHRELADLLEQISLSLAAVALGLAFAVCKRASRIVQELALPLVNLVGVHAVALGHFRRSPLLSHRRQRDLGLEFWRVLVTCILHWSCSSRFWSRLPVPP
jgi:hypothetical protein